MKKLSLYGIRDLALASGRAVFSVQQLANLVGKPKPVAKVYFSRLVRKGLARRLLRGRICFVDDDFVVASQLVEPSYVSLASALLFHGLITQVPAFVESVTPKNSRRFEKLGVVYHKIPPSLFYGFEKYRKGGGYVFVADAEKALIDGVYLGLMPKNLIAEVGKKIDRNKLAAYVSRFKGYGKKTLERLLL